jgi:hypothetical protein
MFRYDGPQSAWFVRYDGPQSAGHHLVDTKAPAELAFRDKGARESAAGVKMNGAPCVFLQPMSASAVGKVRRLPCSPRNA